MNFDQTNTDFFLKKKVFIGLYIILGALTSHVTLSCVFVYLCTGMSWR